MPSWFAELTFQTPPVSETRELLEIARLHLVSFCVMSRWGHHKAPEVNATSNPEPDSSDTKHSFNRLAQL